MNAWKIAKICTNLPEIYQKKNMYNSNRFSIGFVKPHYYFDVPMETLIRYGKLNLFELIFKTDF